MKLSELKECPGCKAALEVVYHVDYPHCKACDLDIHEYFIQRNEEEKHGCTCAQCRCACYGRPGWFAPGEVAAAADYLGTTVEDLFDGALVLDAWLEDDNSLVYAPMPAYGEQTPGGVAEWCTRGRCTFLSANDRCTIHPVKPHECREFSHHDSQDTVHERKLRMIEEWKGAQEEALSLTGGTAPPVPGINAESKRTVIDQLVDLFDEMFGPCPVGDEP